MAHKRRPSPETIKQGHEGSDVNVKGVVWFFVGFTGVAIVLHVLLWWLLELYARGGGDTLRFPGVGEVRPEVSASFWPGELDAEGSARRAAEARELARGVAIPIEQAMAQVIARGLEAGTAAVGVEDTGALNAPRSPHERLIRTPRAERVPTSGTGGPP